MDKRKEYWKAYYEKNKDKLKEYWKVYYEKKKEKLMLDNEVKND